MAGKITAVVLSAGTGQRMHSKVPKQYLDLCGRPVIAWTLDAFQKYEDIRDIILVAGRGDLAYCAEEIVRRYGFTKVSAIVPGGAERGESVLCGLHAAGTDTDYVLIHDGARPLTDQTLIQRVIAGVRKYGAAIPGIAETDTVKMTDEKGFVTSTPPRSTLRRVQTPQAFSYRLILSAYEKALNDGVHVTDDSMAAEYAEEGVRIRVVEGSPVNIKITGKDDLALAEAFLKKSGKIQQEKPEKGPDKEEP